MRTPEGEVLPVVWLQGLDASDQRELVWLKLGPKIKDGTRQLFAVLSKAEATRAGFGGCLKKGADDNEAFTRGVRFGETGWDAAVDEQFVTGRVWRFTGAVPGTVTEATRAEAEAILGPYNDSKVAAAAAAAGR
jgi:hypothetical protein